MGGGTTLIEGSRLGMQMSGNDLNPVAWFVVKQELADVDPKEVKRLLADIEAEVKPQIMPFYYCDGPSGEKGEWTHVPTGSVMTAEFDPLALNPQERKNYRYDGPEIIYTFWDKHGPCQVTGCGHRTPIITSPVFAVKTLTVKAWPHVCEGCSHDFDVEDVEARMAPGAVLYISPEEKPFSVLDARGRITCPHCGQCGLLKLGKPISKAIELALTLVPQWLNGCGNTDKAGNPLGGSVTDDAASTSEWNLVRAAPNEILEIRGSETLVSTNKETGEIERKKVTPREFKHPESDVTIRTDEAGGTVPKKSKFACARCGTIQDVLTAVAASGTSAPVAAYAIQGWSPGMGGAYGGRFFALPDPNQTNRANVEWEERRAGDLATYYSSTERPSTPAHRFKFRFWDVWAASPVVAGSLRDVGPPWRLCGSGAG
jgi:putative DNA methylase